MKPLHPIMVVFLAVSAAAVAQRAEAEFGFNGAQHAQETLNKYKIMDMPAAKEVAGANKISVNEIQAVLSQESGGKAAKADVARRIVDFLFEKDAEGKSFIQENVDRVAADTISELVIGWTLKSPADQVAMLYFAMGPGKVTPAWVEHNEALKNTFKPEMIWEGCLRNKLAGFKDRASAQISQSFGKEQITSFLDEAVQAAQGDGKPGTDMFSTCNTKEETDRNIEMRGYQGLNPMPNGKVLNPQGISGGKASYSFDDMFVKGAVVREVSKPGDKGWRRISMKIYTKRDKDGELTNEIGIFDITNPNKIFGQRFPFTSSGDLLVALGGTGKYEYTLSVNTDGDGRSHIDFGRAGVKPSKPGEPEAPGMISTSIEKLLLERSEQAKELANVVTVGGEDFYVVPQGGAKGALVMLPKDAVDNGTMANARKTLRPQLYAEIAQRGSEGNAVNIKYKDGARLGRVSGEDFCLTYSDKAKLWEIKSGCKGDEPKVQESTEGGEGGTGGGGKRDSKDSDGSDQTIAALEALALKTNSCEKKEDADTKDLDDDLKDKFGVFTCKDEASGLPKLLLLVPKKIEPSQQLIYNREADFVRARFYKHYVLLQKKNGAEYWDLNKRNGTIFLQSGTVDFDKKGPGMSARNFLNDELLLDVILMHLDERKIKAEDFNPDAVVERVKKRVGAKSYSISAGVGAKKIQIDLTVGGKSFEVWPGDMVSEAGKANTGLMGSEDAEIPDSLQIDSAHTTEVFKKQADIALFRSVPNKEASDQDEKYYLIFRYNTKVDGSIKVQRTKEFEVFRPEEDLRKPDHFEMAALVGAADEVKDPSLAAYGRVPGSNDERGVIRITQNRNISGEGIRDKKANCAGPVLWWGITGGRKEALEICQKDRF